MYDLSIISVQALRVFALVLYYILQLIIVIIVFASVYFLPNFLVQDSLKRTGGMLTGNMIGTAVNQTHW